MMDKNSTNSPKKPMARPSLTKNIDNKYKINWKISLQTDNRSYRIFIYQSVQYILKFLFELNIQIINEKVRIDWEKVGGQIVNGNIVGVFAEILIRDDYVVVKALILTSSSNDQKKIDINVCVLLTLLSFI